MKKMCIACGAIFEQKTNEKYCSEKCEKKSKVSFLDMVKKPIKKKIVE